MGKDRGQSKKGDCVDLRKPFLQKYMGFWIWDMGGSRFHMVGGWDAPRNIGFTSRVEMECTQVLHYMSVGWR
jgi:hypothetical protein